MGLSMKSLANGGGSPSRSFTSFTNYPLGVFMRGLFFLLLIGCATTKSVPPKPAATASAADDSLTLRFETSTPNIVPVKQVLLPPGDEECPMIKLHIEDYVTEKDLVAVVLGEQHCESSYKFSVCLYTLERRDNAFKAVCGIKPKRA